MSKIRILADIVSISHHSKLRCVSLDADFTVVINVMHIDILVRNNIHPTISRKLTARSIIPREANCKPSPTALE